MRTGDRELHSSSEGVDRERATERDRGRERERERQRGRETETERGRQREGDSERKREKEIDHSDRLLPHLLRVGARDLQYSRNPKP